MADFDAIVVGAGCAGSVAAYTLASAGKNVLMVERGVFAGAKNMTGGRIYSHSLKKVFPDFEQTAPLERKITHERIALIDPSGNLSLDFTSDELGVEAKDSYSVLRSTFDQWLAEQAENAGAEAIYGIAVEELLKDETGRIVGIKAGDDEITADVVIVADGVNSLLTENFLGAPRPKPNLMAVGIKQVYSLPADRIEDRFLCPEGEGAAMLFVGDCTKGNVGGGFLYTNKESISLGLVATISTTAEQSTPVYQMLEDFKAHPSVAPILRDATLVEHSGHMVPEGGYYMIPSLVHDGALVAGEAGMLCMNLGYQVRGMDLAVESGRLAGEAAVRALEKQDTSASALDWYQTALDESFVIQDMKTFRRWPQTMEHWDRMFTIYPKMTVDIFNSLFSVDGKPQARLKDRMMPIIKNAGLFKLMKEVRGALKAL